MIIDPYVIVIVIGAVTIAGVACSWLGGRRYDDEDMALVAELEGSG